MDPRHPSLNGSLNVRRLGKRNRKHIIIRFDDNLFNEATNFSNGLIVEVNMYVRKPIVVAASLIGLLFRIPSMSWTCLFLVLCVVEFSDHSSRGVLSSVERLCVIVKPRY